MCLGYPKRQCLERGFQKRRLEWSYLGTHSGSDTRHFILIGSMGWLYICLPSGRNPNIAIAGIYPFSIGNTSTQSKGSIFPASYVSWSRSVHGTSAMDRDYIFGKGSQTYTPTKKNERMTRGSFNCFKMYLLLEIRWLSSNRHVSELRGNLHLPLLLGRVLASQQIPQASDSTLWQCHQGYVI